MAQTASMPCFALFLMDPYLSKKLRNLSFLLLGVVAFIHGFNANIRFSDGQAVEPSRWVFFIQHFVSDGMCRLAVPLFFAISGYLAFLSSGDRFSFEWLIHNLKKRIYSLLIPYLLVSLLGIALVIGLQLIPFARPFFNNFSLTETSLGRWIFIWLVSPVPYQLWFVRFLLFYFLILPLIYGVVKYLKVVGLIFLFYTWYSFYFQEITGITKIEYEGLFFFSVGAFFAIHRLPVTFQISGRHWLMLFAGWLLWIGYRTDLLFKTYMNDVAVHSHLLGFTLAGLGLAWTGYDLISDRLHKWNWLTHHAGFSFGVFLFHEPLLTIIKKLVIKVGSGSDLTLMVAYVVAPVSAFLLALAFSKALHRFLPQTYGILTGNRLPSASRH